jgi:hypothetical protein
MSINTSSEGFTHLNMDKKKLAKNTAVALGFVGLAIAAPHLLPALALASKDYFGEIFSSLFSNKDTEDSLGKISVNVLSGVLTNLGSSAVEKIPGALSREHSFHLETALATAYLETLNALSLKIKEKGDDKLFEQSESVFPLLKSRIERALQDKNLDLLFPVQNKVLAQEIPTARASLNRLSAEDLTLSLADVDKMKALIADDIEIALRRWSNEERAYRQGSLGMNFVRDYPDMSLLTAMGLWGEGHRQEAGLILEELDAFVRSYGRPHLDNKLQEAGLVIEMFDKLKLWVFGRA